MFLSFRPSTKKKPVNYTRKYDERFFVLPKQQSKKSNSKNPRADLKKNEDQLKADRKKARKQIIAAKQFKYNKLNHYKTRY